MALLTPPQSTTATPAKEPAHQQVYARLRDLILFGDLAPGQAVTIQGLITQLGAGMTPVREALRRLIAEGALIHQGNRRVIVPLLTSQCVQELDFLRITLEPELTRRATSLLSDAGIAALIQVDNDLNTAISQGDVGRYLTKNYQFHAMIYAKANAPIMAATVDQLWLRFGPSLRVVCGKFGTLNLPDRHADILAAIRDRDADFAAASMKADVAQGMLQISAAVQS